MPEIEEEKLDESPLKKPQSQLLQTEPLITDTNAFFLCINMGWLFDNPLFPRELFIIEPNIYNNDVASVIKKSTTGLDGKKNLTVNLLYNCCPYLSELKVILCQFYAGYKGTNRKQTNHTPNRINKIVAAKISAPVKGNV